MKVLLATDGSTYSEAALKAITSRCWPDETQFLVLHVVQAIVPTYMGFNYGYAEALAVLDESEKRMAQKIIDESVKTLTEKFPNLKVVGKTCQGYIVDEIIKTAKEFDSDLIVVGSHGLRGLTKFFLGSVSEAVLNRAPCSIEIIRVDLEKESNDRHESESHQEEPKKKEEQSATG